MKKISLSLTILLFFFAKINAQVGINSTGAAPHPSAMLDVNSTTKGLLIPRMSTTDKNNISPKPAGLMIYDNTLNRFQNWNGVTWTGNEWTTVGNDIVNFNSGNVGIGNGAPQNKLTIGSTISPFAGNDLSIGNSLGGGMSLYQSGGASSGASIWYSNSNFALMPVGGGSGSVGINYTNPLARLDIYQTGKVQNGFGAYISPMRVGIGVTGSHAIAADNYDAVGVAGFGANAGITKRNIGILGTTDITGNQNIGVMAYQNGLFNNTVYGTYSEVNQTGVGEVTASFNRISNANSGTSFGVYSEVTNTKASGNLSNFGVTTVVSSNASNANTSNYGFYANVTGAGRNFGVFTSASGGTENYAIAAYGNSYIDGNVAIGSINVPVLPKAKFVVTGFQATTNSLSSFFNPGNTVLASSASSNSNNSIYATHGIISALYMGAAQTVTASDNRIKNIISLSNNSEDLELLKKIEITNYQMKDKDSWGNQTFKKVIAQQVESVYPEVIKKQTSVIPDIYTLAESVVYDAQNKNLSISMSKDYGIKSGDKLELVHPEKGKIQTEVISVSYKTFTVKDWEYPTDKIFVFGREVNDFRSVDYEALSMLGISAIQQLAKENEQMKKENTKQKEDFNKRLESVEETLKAMNQAIIK